MNGLDHWSGFGATVAPVRHCPQRICFKHADLVTSLDRGDREPNLSVLLPTPPLRETIAIVCMARFARSS